MKKYTYFITGEEWRNANIWTYFFMIAVVFIDTSIVAAIMIGKLTYDFPVYLVPSLTGLNWILVLVFFLIRHAGMPFRTRRMYRHDITIDGDTLHYVLANETEKLESEFTISKVKENSVGIKYYKSRFCYVFVPRRVVNGGELMDFKFTFDDNKRN